MTEAAVSPLHQATLSPFRAARKRTIKPILFMFPVLTRVDSHASQQDEPNRPTILRAAGVLLLLLVIVFKPTVGRGFPFREFDPGEPVPAVTLQSLQGESPLSFSRQAGTPFIALFWGADVPAKRERSITILQKIEFHAHFFAQRHIPIYSINIQGDGRQAIQEVIQRSASTLPVYRDPEKQAYGDLGVFVMPAVLLVDGQGNAAAGLGYSHDIIKRLQDAVRIMTGEKTRAELDMEQQRTIIEKSPAAKAASRHMHLGLVLLRQGFADSAIRELEKAVELDAALTRAHIELGCLYIEKNLLNKADEALGTGLAASPNSISGLLCQGKLKIVKGLYNEAAIQLKEIKKRAPAIPEPDYLLGTIHETLHETSTAMSHYKAAYQLLEKNIREQTLQDKSSANQTFADDAISPLGR